MSNTKTVLRHAVVAGVLLTMLAGSIGLSQAEQVLKSPNQGVRVQLSTPVQGATAAQGQAFEATLPEDVRYKNWMVPAGTTFKGEITQVDHSHHFSRPGYVVLQVEQATLPNGNTFSFDPDKYKPRNKRLHHPDALNFVQTVAYQLPYNAVASGLVIPLHYAADVNGPVLAVIAQAVRMGVGAVVGLVRPKFKEEPVPRKLALGTLDGSGVPRAVGFFAKYPEPDYHAGDTIKLYFNPTGLTDMFQNTSASAASVPQPSLTAQGHILQAAQTTP